MAKTVFLIDGHNLLYRAHFVLIKNPLINSKGMNTSVCHGVTLMIQKVLATHDPQWLAVAFDRAEPTFRKQEYDDYKKGRPPMPGEIQEQLPIVHDILDGYGIPVVEVAGYEADDVIGTITERMKAQDFKVVILTGDKDLLQLVDQHVTVHLLKVGVTEFETMHPPEVQQKYGVTPAQIVDLLALSGDAADNIPGVPGVGPKTAAKLIQQFGSIDLLLANLDAVKMDKVRQNIHQNQEDVRLGKYLATIKRDVPLELTVDQLQRSKVDVAKLRKLFTDLEFRSLLDKLTAVQSEQDFTTVLVQQQPELETLCADIQAAGMFAYDLETTAADPMQANLVGIALAYDRDRAFYIPVGHATADQQLSLATVQQYLGPLLLEPRLLKIGHNIKYDWIVSRRHGLELDGPIYDTMVFSYLYEPLRRQHNLDALSMDHLGYRKIPTVELIGKGASQITMAQVAIAKVANYACEDAVMTMRLYDFFQPQLDQAGYRYLYEEVEAPLIRVLVAMEMAGIKVDPEQLAELAGELRAKLSDLIEAIYAEAGEEFNINSPKQLNKILFDKLQYPTRGLKKTTHGWSTDEETLSKLIDPTRGYIQFPELLLDYRGFSKLLTTYLEALPRMINPRTGRIHTSFNQTITETGRLSSSDPNLQNIPARGEWGAKIRMAFIPDPPDWSIISADYSQIELRIMAHVSGDPTLKDLFSRGVDIHAGTAQEIFALQGREVTPDQRRMAKAINFGIMYGMNEYGLSQRLKISLEEAKTFIAKYFQRFPGIKTYIEQTCATAREQGYVATLLNRKRFLPEITSANRNIREAACRRAINMPIQGTAADLIKIAMNRIHDALTKNQFQTRMLLQVHDELVFESPPNEIDLVMNLIRFEMENALALDVPLKVEIKSGRSWADVH